VLGKDDRVLFPKDEATVIMAGDRAVMKSGVVTTYEETVTDAVGRLTTFLSTKGPIHDANGEVLGLFGIARDITSRRVSEAALRQSEAQLQVILDATADGILAVDTSGHVVKTNHRFAELWRVPEALLEQGDDAALLAFVQDQLVDPEAFLRRVQALYTSDETAVDAIVFKDGRVFERHSAVTRQNSVVTGRVWSFSDVSEHVRARTQLQERERALDTLMGNLPGMAYRCLNDPRWTMQFVSAGCEVLTGHPPQALLGSATVAYGDLVFPEDAPRLWQEIQTAISAREPWKTARGPNPFCTARRARGK
jgi:PAS domain-containing protein